MPSSITLLTAAIAAAVQAVPLDVEPVRPRIGYTVSTPLTLSPKSLNLNPAFSLAYPYVKYNAVQPAVVKAAVVKQQQKAAKQKGSATITPEPVDVEYLVPVNVDGQTLNLVLDSGSSDLWVFSDLMPAAQQTGHAIYKTDSSKIMSGEKYDVSYGDGSYSRGLVYKDRVTIGGVTFDSQAVEAAQSVSQSFLNHIDADGLIGLSFTALNTVRPTQQKTFFDNVKSSLAQPLYAVTLKNRGQNALTTDHIGSLDFGFINRTKYVGDLHWTPVNPANAGFWQFSILRYAINGTTFKMSTGAFNTIVDTGTSLSYLPNEIITAYYAKVKGAGVDSNWGGYTFPCDSKLPPMGVWINGRKFGIRPKYINWQQINATHCLGGVQSSSNLPFAILGDTFIKGFYVIFDQRQSTPRVGLARQNPNL
ncbi:aspartic peptidase domain-containing protein [Elsinoe ampelina]|uniref:Aspartic peptidase domain-containing protein n=1 Tax=Elsinoe ampelina TaxID=302913 RepID=A0A6A6G9Q0_9PEZI|nr:aspartic peptidase domain-containing protein [Elsinoe ampelina]